MPTLRDVVNPRDAGPAFARGTNPVLGGDHPDPHVVRTVGADGRAIDDLHPTAGAGDFAVWSSRDLVPGRA